MYDANLELNPSTDWTECSSARAWARTDLPLESIPTFGSSARSRCHQSIADDESEIKRLEDSIRRAESKLQELRHRIGRNRARVAPIRSIPNETLSAIFLAWLHIRDSPTSVPDGCFAPPSTIMKVCRRWADCAVSTPAIWTHGEYLIDASEIARFNRTALLKEYFDRSGSCNIKVRFVVDGSHHTEDIWREVVEPSLFRVEDFSFSGLCRSIYPVSNAAPDGRRYGKFIESLTICSRLNKLCLTGLDFPESDYQTTIELPTVRSIGYFVCSGNAPIHCPSLVACEIQDCTLSPSYIVSLSVGSPLLEKVLVRSAYLDCEEDEVPQSRWPAFPNLKHLEADFQDGMSISRCFSDSPNICRLDIYLSDDSFHPAIEVISMWSSSLTYITLTLPAFMMGLHHSDVQYVHEWMATARNLLEYHLIFLPDVDEDVFYKACGMSMYIEPLLTSKRDPPCFPRLRHITITGEWRLEVVLSQLLAERTSDTERLAEGISAHDRLSDIIQRPCLLTLVNAHTLPDMESVGLTEFLDLCERHAAGESWRTH